MAGDPTGRGVAVTLVIGDTSTEEQTTLNVLLTKVSAETLSVPLHESLSGSSETVDPKMPVGITTLKSDPSYSNDPVLEVVKIAVSLKFGMVDVQAMVNFESVYVKPLANPVELEH